MATYYTDRNFWAHCEAVAAEVARWPAWMRGETKALPTPLPTALPTVEEIRELHTLPGLPPEEFNAEFNNHYRRRECVYYFRS
jgi:hypothetical protein